MTVSHNYTSVLRLVYCLQSVSSADDISILNDLCTVSCVIRLYYPSHIQPADLLNVKVHSTHLA